MLTAAINSSRGGLYDSRIYFTRLRTAYRSRRQRSQFVVIPSLKFLSVIKHIKHVLRVIYKTSKMVIQIIDMVWNIRSYGPGGSYGANMHHEKSSADSRFRYKVGMVTKVSPP